MIRIPLYADPVDSRGYNDLGSEFHQIQSNDRYRGLMDSENLNPVATLSNNVDDLYADGISNQMRIFENNSDLSDNRLYTDAQQLIRLQNIGSIDRPLNAEERALSEAVGYDLDPNIRNRLVEEATRQGDNIYAQESQDFVKQVQEDVEQYAKEVNLYYQGVPSEDRLTALLSGRVPGLEGVIDTRPTPDPFTNEIIKVLDKMDREEKEEIRETIRKRESIMKQRRGGKAPPKKTEEKLYKPKSTKSSSPSSTPQPRPQPGPIPSPSKTELR